VQSPITPPSDEGHTQPYIAKRRTSNAWLLFIIGMAALALCAVCLGITGLLTLALRTNSVTVLIGGEAFQTETRAQTVGNVLVEMNISLDGGDIVDPPLAATLIADQRIVIARARPVTITSDGVVRVLNTPLSNPADILARANIALNEADQLLLDGTLVDAAALTEWPVPVNSISVQRARTITIVEGDSAQTFTTTAQNVGEALFAADVTVFVADTITPELNAPLSEGLQIAIVRASPITIVADGQRREVRIQGTQVADALALAGVTLSELDYSVPNREAQLVAGMTIRVIRVQETIITESAELPFETVYQADAAIELDQTRVAQAGQTGTQETRIRVRSENGIEVERATDTTTITRPPVNQVIVYGTNVVIRTIDTPQGPREYWRVLRMYATSYHPAALGGDDVTATGRRLTNGIIASNPRVIPYGAEVFVEGYGVGLMADTAGVRRFPLWIDLGYSDADFRSWSRYVDVYLLTPVPPNIDYIVP
jgi:resuscitation-promoting factor RpfB